MSGLSLRLCALAAAGGLALGAAAGWTVRDGLAARAALRSACDREAAAAEALAQTQEAAAVTARVEQAAAQRRQARATIVKTLIRKVPVYVTPEADARCPVPVGFVRLHDAAAAGAASPAVPGPAGLAHDAPSGLELSAVAATVADNYGACHAVAEQLSALQNWIRFQASADGAP